MRKSSSEIVFFFNFKEDELFYHRILMLDEAYRKNIRLGKDGLFQ